MLNRVSGPGWPGRQDTPRQGQTARGRTARGKTARGQAARGQTTRGQTPRGKTARGKTVQGQTAQGQIQTPGLGRALPDEALWTGSPRQVLPDRCSRTRPPGQGCRSTPRHPIGRLASLGAPVKRGRRGLSRRDTGGRPGHVRHHTRPGMRCPCGGGPAAGTRPRRQDSASAMWMRRTASLPSRSAMVRATRRTR